MTAIALGARHDQELAEGNILTVVAKAGGTAIVKRYYTSLLSRTTNLLGTTSVGTTATSFGPYNRSVTFHIETAGAAAEVTESDSVVTELGDIAANSLLVNGSTATGPAAATYVDQFLAGPQTQLKKWRAALARVRAGTGRARLVLIGDSTTAGVGAGTSGASNSVGAFANSRTTGLVARMSSLGVPVSHNSFFGDQGMITLPTAYPSYDPRVSYGANWSAPAGGSTSTLAGQMFLYTTGTANNLTFTPLGQIDNAIVYYAKSGSNGSFTWNVDGGTSFGTVATNGGPSLNTAVSGAFTKGNHTINFVPNNNNNIYIAGCLAYDSTVPAVDVIQAGWAGALITSFNIATSPWHPVGMFNLLAPDLTIVQLTINNSNAATSVASYTADLQAIVSRALAVGDCIIESGIPSGTANATNGVLAGLVAAARAVAVANNVPFIDIGARWQSYTVANGLGWMYDTLHPNAVGYQDVGQAEAQVLALA